MSEAPAAAAPDLRPGYLSPHFSLAELTITQHRGINNSAPAAVLRALTDTARRMEAVRALLGEPIVVSSAYRCPQLNAAVGSKPTSAHMAGRAVDFVCPGFGGPLAVARAIEAAGIAFDQLIYEQTWVHISFDPRMRGQLLTMRGGKYSSGLNG